MDFNRFIDYGAADSLKRPDDRIRAGEEIAKGAAWALARGVKPKVCENWFASLQGHWDYARDRQGGEAGQGWPELLAGMLVAAELLAETLPGNSHQSLGSYATEVESAFQRARQAFARYALPCSADVVLPVRLLVAHESPVGAKRSTRFEDTLAWRPCADPARITTAAFPDRNHTLLLGLLAAEAHGDAPWLPADRPLAAIGAVDTDLARVRAGTSAIRPVPVNHLQRAARGFFETHGEHESLLLSGPPSSIEADDWRGLMQFQEQRARRGDRSMLDMTHEPTRARIWARCITAAGVRELRAKLELWAQRGPVVESWDGKPLSSDHIAPMILTWQGDKPDDVAHTDDPFIEALRRAMSNARTGHGPRTVLVEGEPGAGKSLWARLLESRSATGPLGVLGHAVYRGARAFAAALDAAPDTPLVHDESESDDLIVALQASQRLILVIDGLDELEPGALQRVVTWLHTRDLACVLTTRALPWVHQAVDQAIRLTLEPLRPENAAALLVAHERGELARQLFGRDLRTEPGGVMGALCERPFTLSLLMRAIRPGERIADIDESELYARTYRDLVAQAGKSSARLDADQVVALQEGAGDLIGELSLCWLRSESGFISHTQLGLMLAERGHTGARGVSIRRALEFGYLLTRAGRGWQFAHRTLAEWAAAQALDRRVQLALHRAGIVAPPGHDGSHPDEWRAYCRALGDHEMAELEWLFAERLVPESTYAQVLRFYMPHCRAPERIMQRMFGPKAHAVLAYERKLRTWMTDPERSAEMDRYVMVEHLHLAMDLLARARWRYQEPARRAWAVAVRTWLMPDGLRPRGVDEWNFKGPIARTLMRFARAVDGHLYGSLEHLIDDAAFDHEQRAWLHEDATLLLPLCATVASAAFLELRDHGTLEQAVAIFAWQLALRDQPGARAYRDAELDRLAMELPGRLSALDDPSNPLDHDEEVRRRELLMRMEQAVYRLAQALDQEIAWPVMRRRIQQWPPFLEDVFLQWFARTRETSDRRSHWSVPIYEARWHPLLDPVTWRRDMIGVFLAMAIDAQRDHDALAASAPEPGQIAGARYHRASTTGVWTRILEKIVKALGQSPEFDRVVGGFWQSLPRASQEARVFLDIVMRAGRLPVQVDVTEVLSLIPDERRNKPYWWPASPSELGIWRPEHERAWRELAERGRGRSRYLALLWCAQRDQRELAEVLAVDMHADEELEALLLEWWCDGQRKDEEYARLRADYLRAPERMPLAYRARQDVPGWREDVQALLERPGCVGHVEAMILVRRYCVSEALPALMRAWQAWRGDSNHEPEPAEIWHALMSRSPMPAQVAQQLGARVGHYCELARARAMDALLGLLQPDDPAHRAWFTSVPVDAWFDAPVYTARDWSRLCQFLALDDLPRILAARQPPHSGLDRDEGLTPYWERLGTAGHEDVVAALRRCLAERAQRAAAADPDGDTSTIADARDLESWIRELQRAAVITGLPGCSSTSALVELTFAVLPSPCGVAFVGTGSFLLAQELRRRVPEWADSTRTLPDQDATQEHDPTHALERLFEHPDHHLQIAAFQLRDEQLPPGQCGALALRALHQHLVHTHEYREADTAWLLCARNTELEVPGWVHRDRDSWSASNTCANLLAAARRHVTPAERDTLFEWLGSERADLRYLACEFIGLVGPAWWAEYVHPRMADTHPAVMSAAVRAWLHLCPGELATGLEALERTAWRAAHYGVFFHLWLETPTARRGDQRGAPRALLEPLDPGFVLSLIGDAVQQLVHVCEPTALELLAFAEQTEHKPRRTVRTFLEEARAETPATLADAVLSQAVRSADIPPSEFLVPWLERLEQLQLGALPAPVAAFLERVREQCSGVAVEPGDGASSPAHAELGASSSGADSTAEPDSSHAAAVAAKDSERARMARFLEHLAERVLPLEWRDMDDPP